MGLSSLSRATRGSSSQGRSVPISTAEGLAGDESDDDDGGDHAGAGGRQGDVIKYGRWVGKERGVCNK